MALSSWNALYTHIEQKFMLKRQWRQLHLLKVFVQHADPFGLSFPGPERISALTGLGTERQINAVMQWLVDGEYIKVYDTWNRRRRIWEPEYQVSPLVMYIREELHDYCLSVWASGERDFDYEQDYVIKRNGQPASESESESTTDNQHQDQHHHPPKSAAKKQGQERGGAHDYESEEKQLKQRQRRKKTGVSRPSEKNPQAGGPPPPDKPDLRKYAAPLTADDEDRAQDLKTVFGMRINQARALVTNYGRDVIEVAGRAVLAAMDKGSCESPPGLLTHLVQRGAISSQDRNLYPTQAEKLAAANADMNAYE